MSPSLMPQKRPRYVRGRFAPLVARWGSGLVWHEEPPVSASPGTVGGRIDPYDLAVPKGHDLIPFRIPE